MIAIVIFSFGPRLLVFMLGRHSGSGVEIAGLVLHMRKDSISAEIMALCIVRWPCGSGGTGSIRCRPISLQLTLTVPTNIR